MRINAEPSDAYAVAFQIAEAVKDMGYDMIVSGIESSDYNGAAVGGMLAEFLELLAAFRATNSVHHLSLSVFRQG